MSRRYDPSAIEPKWQQVWDEEGRYEASEDPADERPRFYALDMFPYPSGDMHMGRRGVQRRRHDRAIPMDAGLQRAASDRVGCLRAAGRERRDPARHAGRGGPTRTSSSSAVVPAHGHVVRLDAAPRHLRPGVLRWTQWLFLQFFEKGLAYRKEAPVNWCPNDQTVLANEQVIGGACERCGTMVERRSLTQWFFKITDYAQRLLDDVDVLVEWPERVLTMQRNWIGRSEGASVIFTIEQTGERIEVFTTARHPVGCHLLRLLDRSSRGRAARSSAAGRRSSR